MQLDRDSVRDWFRAKLPEVETCLACGHKAVHMATEPLELRRISGKDEPPGPVAQVVIPMVCANCGLTLFFDAGMANAVQGAPRPGLE
jgi:transcription elongation factor Elf1